MNTSIELVPQSARIALAVLEGAAAAESATGLRFADGTCGFMGAASPQYIARLRAAPSPEKPDPLQWGYLVVHAGEHMVVGTTGFRKPPDEAGLVEIAYGIAPAFQGRGIATEAARKTIALALASGRVSKVIAHTLAEPNASTRVLTKCGFTHIGTVNDPEDGPVWRWELPAGWS